MPVDPKVLASYIGIDVEALENDDAAKEAFDKVYLKRDVAHTDKGVTAKVFGSINNILRSKLKASGKKFNVEADFDALDPDKGIEALAAGLETRLGELTGELEKAKKGGGKTPEEMAELQKKVEALSKENEAFKKDATEWQGKYTSLNEAVTNEKANKRENDAWAEAMGGWKPREDVSPLAVKGFEAEARGKYKLEFGEDNTVKVLGKDGQIIMNKTKAQTFATLGEVLKADAEAAKLTGGAPQGGAPVRKALSTTAAGMGGGAQKSAEQPAQTFRPQRQVMPR